MEKSYYEEKIKQVDEAIKANEAIDLDTTIQYALKRQYEQAIRDIEANERIEETATDVKEDEEMSPFRTRTENNSKQCLEECSKIEDRNDCVGNCNGCEYMCQFVHDHKGHILINHPKFGVWIGVGSKEGSYETT